MKEVEQTFHTAYFLCQTARSGSVQGGEQPPWVGFRSVTTNQFQALKPAYADFAKAGLDADSIRCRRKAVHESFREYVESLHPSFERLTAMPPVTIKTLPKNAPSQCIYLFSEGARHLYVGRTRNLRQRLRQHSIPASQHNQAVFAFRLAREATGKLVAAYSVEGSRAALIADLDFGTAFVKAKERVRSMDVRFVEETDPLRQALLEIYASIVLKTPYNDFNTH